MKNVIYTLFYIKSGTDFSAPLFCDAVIAKENVYCLLK